MRGDSSARVQIPSHHMSSPASPVRTTLSAFGLAGIAAGITMVFLGMRDVMEIGGACGNGNTSLRLVRECPDGLGSVFFGGAALALVGAALHVVLAPRGGPRPLLLAFHGWGGSPTQLEATTRLVERGVARGYIVVRPFGHNQSFNAGTCCGLASELHVDDVAFARAIVENVAGTACVDRKRVYSTGFSNGGFLSHRLGCEAAEVFAAVASVSGTFGVGGCAPSRPVPAMHVHGAIDGIVAYGGNEAKHWSSVATVVDRWLTVDGCKGKPTEEIFARGKARCVRNAACAGGAEVVLCRDGGAAHTWPGGPKSVGWGGSQDLDATAAILDFFGRHALD